MRHRAVQQGPVRRGARLLAGGAGCRSVPRCQGEVDAIALHPPRAGGWCCCQDPRPDRHAAGGVRLLSARRTPGCRTRRNGTFIEIDDGASVDPLQVVNPEWVHAHLRAHFPGLPLWMRVCSTRSRGPWFIPWSWGTPGCGRVSSSSSLWPRGSWRGRRLFKRPSEHGTAPPGCS